MIGLVLILLALLPPTASGFQGAGGLVWPPPPERARIRYEGMLTEKTGFESGRGFFGDLFAALFGEHRTSTWLIQPVGIAVSPEGTLYVADPGIHGVHIIHPAEKKYGLVTETKFGPFRSPVGCATDRDGKVYVTDSDGGAIIVMDSDGDGDEIFREGLTRPTGIQVEGDTIYVSDAGVHKILVLDRSGKLLGSFGGRGAGALEFNFPVQLAAADSLYVLDALNYRVETLDLQGRFGSTFGSIGNVAGRFAAPKSIALDPDGNIYVADGLMDNVQIFDHAGRLLLVFGRNGTGEGEFAMPSGIAITPGGAIYVVDSMNRRIQMFQYLR